MPLLLKIAASVATPIAAICFIAVIAFYAYSRWLRTERTRLRVAKETIEILPPDQRAKAVDEWLTRYNLTAEGMSDEYRKDLMVREMDHRERTAERKSRENQRYALIAAVVFVICFVTSVIALAVLPRGTSAPEPSGTSAPEPKQRVSRLTISLQGSKLTTPSGLDLSDNPGVFEGDGLDAVTDQAAGWVVKMIADKFPRNEPELQVTAHVKIDPSGDEHQISLKPNDPLRQDRFWVFAGDLKFGHIELGVAQEATRAAISAARSAAAAELRMKKELNVNEHNIPVTRLLLHCDRPGYRTALFEVPVSGAEVKHTLTKLPDPWLTIIVKSITGDPLAAERLREKLRRPAMVVGGADMLSAKEKAYESSKAAGLLAHQRQALLLDARIDAFVEGSYSETTK